VRAGKVCRGVSFSVATKSSIWRERVAQDFVPAVSHAHLVSSPVTESSRSVRRSQSTICDFALLYGMKHSATRAPTLRPWRTGSGVWRRRAPRLRRNPMRRPRSNGSVVARSNARRVNERRRIREIIREIVIGLAARSVSTIARRPSPPTEASGPTAAVGRPVPDAPR
jgi:hypothetical protein